MVFDFLKIYGGCRTVRVVQIPLLQQPFYLSCGHKVARSFDLEDPDVEPLAFGAGHGFIGHDNREAHVEGQHQGEQATYDAFLCHLFFGFEGGCQLGHHGADVACPGCQQEVKVTVFYRGNQVLQGN